MKIQSICKHVQIVVFVLILYSCANLGTPNGGPYDETPPKFVSSKPAPGQIQYKGTEIDILFDELVQIDKPSENVIITPPQKLMPVIRASGKRAVVELKDSLHENTTYTIDFTNSIGDNNENNLLENFTFAFSTGDVIDSLEIAGYLLSAENLEPMAGITVGLHNNLDDSAFVKLPFARTSRTNDRGRFVIRNIAPGTYRVFALKDANRDYLFDNPNEEIAFCDSLIIPAFEFASRPDTLWKDSVTVDTIKIVDYTRFLPDNLDLRLFREKFQRQYILRPERTQENLFTLRFNAPLDTIPNPVPLNFNPEKEWYFPQWAEEGKAVHYWLTVPDIWMQDTLKIEITYPESDSLNILHTQTDTLSLTIRRRPEPKPKKKDGEPEPVVFLGMNIDAPSSMDVFDTISVVFDEPVLDIDKALFRLEQKTDTIWTPVDFEFYPDSTNSLAFFIGRNWKYGEEYKLEVDSASIYSIYGKWNNGFSQTFKMKTDDEYGHLYIYINGRDTLPAFVEILNGTDAPVKKARVEGDGVLFMDLKPDKYYARIVLDGNENFVWDTGNYAGKQQPEVVIYCPKVFEIKKNWQIEETWDIHSTPFIKQKPLDITKNKPKEVTKQKRDYRDEGRQSSGSSQSGFSRPF
jgi:hypothetical protein